MEGLRSKLVYNGVDLRDYGLYVSGDKAFNSPKKEYTKVSIPGRSGDLFIFDGRYSNVMLEYEAILVDDFRNQVEAIRQILLQPEGYVRIEDGYNPDEYRLGVFEGPLDVDAVLLEAGTCTLQFNCMPQRWLKSGDDWISTPLPAITPSVDPPQSVILNNPVAINGKVSAALPGIGLYGSGEVKIEIRKARSSNSYSLTDTPIYEFTYKNTENSGTYYIDCEEMECFKASIPVPESTWQYVKDTLRIDPGDENPNSYLVIDEFPKLENENTVITFRGVSGSFPHAYIFPRWYIL